MSRKRSAQQLAQQVVETASADTSSTGYLREAHGVDLAEANRIADHITELLNRYLDSIEMEQYVQYEARDAMAKEITAKLEKYSIAQRLDCIPKEDSPFSLGGGVSGIGQIYWSLARFLSGKYLHRLGRCPYCKALFIAPDDRPNRKYCPGSDHRKRHWNEERARSGYHRQDMAMRRDPLNKEGKFDEKYTR